MNIKEYIDSGILEAYVLGAVTEAEEQEVLVLKKQYPEVRNALHELELDIEHIAGQMAIQPPPGAWDKINNNIHGLIHVPEVETDRYREQPKKEQQQSPPASNTQYIEVEAIGNQMRIHKVWRWVFAAVFVLGKIFLACAIYFYLENRQAQRQIDDLKQQLQHYQKR